MSASVRIESMMSGLEFVQNNVCQVRGEFLIIPQETFQEALLEVRWLCLYVIPHNLFTTLLLGSKKKLMLAKWPCWF